VSRLSSPRRRLLAWLLAWLLAAVLVAAQALGFTHRVLHTAGLPGAPGASHLSLGAVSAAEPAARELQLFDEHAPGSEQCRLLDQASHGDGLVSSAQASALAPSGAQRPAPAQCARAAAPAANYLARGPPGAAWARLHAA
jgi:hypothetical protein